MLDHLDARVGHRVLEIGTGTGWNAALLAHRLGAKRVTSIEIDPEVAARARNALSRAGYGGVTTIVGDGSRGHLPGAPYDRLIATVAAKKVPYHWVEQTRPGGRIVLPLDLDCTGVLVAMDVTENGVAIGYIFDHATFMRLRDQRGKRGFASASEQNEQADVTETCVHPSEVANPYHSLGSIIAIGIQVDSCRIAYYPRPELDDDVSVLWLGDRESGSWARLLHNPASDGPYPVYQYGPRRLWNEVEAAHSWWVRNGRPGADGWCFTITPEGQRIELVSS